MIQVDKSVVVAEHREVAQRALEFARCHCLLLPQLLGPGLLDFVMQRLDQKPWRDKTHEGIGTEDILADSFSVSALNFAVNAPAFLDVVRTITACSDIAFFYGRIYRLIPGTAHHDSWHSDMAEDRRVGMSINLSAHPFEGGHFQLRKRESSQIVAELMNARPGDGSLFRIADDLEHQVSTVTGRYPRVAYAGWFAPRRTTLYASIRATRERAL